MKKIVVLQDTPFDKEGEVLDIKEFRLKYGYFSTSSATNDEIIEHIERERKLYHEELMNTDQANPIKRRKIKERIGCWFGIREVHDEISFPFGKKRICIVKSIDDHLFLYEPESKQYFQVNDIYNWFVSFANFLKGFTAKWSSGPCQPASLNLMSFSMKDHDSYRFQMEMNSHIYKDQSDVKSWELVRKHLKGYTPNTNIEMIFRGNGGNIHELFVILDFIENLDEYDCIPLDNTI